METRPFNDYEFVVINGIYQKPLTSIMCKLVHVVNSIISGERYRTNGPLVCFLNISFVKAGGVWQAKCRIVYKHGFVNNKPVFELVTYVLKSLS